MEGIVSRSRACAKRRLLAQLPMLREARLRTRYLILIHRLEGRSPTWIAQALKVSRATVYRIEQRFFEDGEAGLFDRRDGNGTRKLTEEYLLRLRAVVAADPPSYGWPRPTWTRELLIKTLRRLTGVKIGLSTMSRALRRIRARRGRPKPAVECPWPEAEKQQCLQQIEHLLAHLPANEVAVWEDEIDIHLNPKIGWDWMLRGQQKQVVTPGRNEKRYLAGAQDVRTKELITVTGHRKYTALFVLLLWELTQRYPQAKKIHVILDNYGIHTTHMVRESLATPLGQRLHLHFLPPYCPDHNRIERSWQDLHANVTRNHHCPTMPHLMRNVRGYLRRHNHRQARTIADHQQSVSKSTPVI
jgi:transposase